VPCANRPDTERGERRQAAEEGGLGQGDGPVEAVNDGEGVDRGQLGGGEAREDREAGDRAEV